MIRWVASIFAVLLLSACAEERVPRDTGSPDGGTDSDTEAALVLPESAGVHQLTLEHDGAERRFDLVIPGDLSGNSSLLIVLHGTGGSGPSFRMLRQSLVRMADERGWVLVFPSALESNITMRTRWNYDGDPEQPDDVGFILKLAEVVGSALPTAQDEAFLTGFSNGGRLVHQLIALHPKAFAAGAPIGSNLGVRVSEESDEGITAPPTGPVPILMGNGSDDSSVPWDGGAVGGGFAAPVQEAIDRWVTANGCDAAATREPFESGGGFIDTWAQGCTDGTVVIQVGYQTSRHEWPDPGDIQGWDASSGVLDFFESL